MTKIGKIKQEVKYKKWAEMIQQRVESGITVKEWCKEYGIANQTYYYRLEKVRKYLCKPEQHDIVPITPQIGENIVAEQRNIEIKIGNAVVVVPNGIDKQTLTTVIEALR